MQPDDPRARRLLDVTFAFLLLGGAMTALSPVLAVSDWISSWGEDRSASSCSASGSGGHRGTPRGGSR